MHVVFPKNKLIEYFTIVSKAIPSKTPMSVLKGIFLKATKDKFIIIANNLELAIKATVDPQTENDIEIIETGSLVIHEKIIEILRQLPLEKVELKMEANTYRLNITSGQAKFHLYGMEPEEYPDMSDEEDWKEWSCLSFSAKEFKEFFKGVAFAISQDEGKPVFKGILTEMTEENEKSEQILSTMATDTYRLAQFEKKYIGEEKIRPFRLLLPGKILLEILRAIDDDESDIKCYFKERELIIIYKNFNFSSRLLEDKYPDFRNVFPPSFETSITLSKSMFERMIQRALLLSQGINQMISLQIDGETLKIRAVSELGRMDEELALESKEGEDLAEIYVNARFILEPMRYLENSVVNIKFNGSLGPCVFSEENEEANKKYRYLALPIRTE